jgi:hypothetical protein
MQLRKPVPRIHGHSSQCKNTILCFRHGTQCTLQRLLPQCPKCLQLRRWGSIPQDGSPFQINGAIHVTCTMLKLVAASAAEVEFGAFFLNAQEAKVLCLVLEELGHPQPPTPIHINNTTTVGIVNNTIKQQQLCKMEMRYFWLLYGEAQ